MSDVKSPSSLIQSSLKGILEQANKGIDNLKTSPQMKSLGKAVTSAYGQVSDTTSKLVAVTDHQIKHNLFVTGNGDPFLKVETDTVLEVPGLAKLVVPVAPKLNSEGKQGLVASIYNAIIKLPASNFESDIEGGESKEGEMTWKSVRDAFNLLKGRPALIDEISVGEIYEQKITLWIQMLSQVKNLFEMVGKEKGSEYAASIVDVLEVQLGEKEIPGDKTEVGSDIQRAVIGRMDETRKRSLLKVLKSVQTEDGMIHAGILSIDEAAMAVSAMNDVIFSCSILEEREGFKDLKGDGIVAVTKLLSLKVMAEDAAVDPAILLMAAEDVEMIDLDKAISWVNGEHEDFYIEGETKETRISVINASRPWIDKVALGLAEDQREIYTQGIQEVLYNAIDWNREIGRRMVENGVNLEDDEQYVTHLIGGTKVLGWKEHQTQLFFGTMDVKNGSSNISLRPTGEIHQLFKESEAMIEGGEGRSSWLDIPDKFKGIKSAEDYLDAFDAVVKLQSNPLTQISAVHGRMQMKWLVGYARWLKKTIGDATMFTGHKFYFHTSRFAKSHLPEWKLTDEYEGKIAKYHPGMLQLMNAGLAKNIQRTVKTYQWEDGHNAFALTTLGICSAFAGIGLAGTLKSTVMAVETQIGWRSAGTLAWNSARGNLFRRAWTRAAGTLLEFEAATVGFTVGTDAFMTPIAGVPTFDKFSNNLMVNGVVFGALDIAGFGLLKVFRMNPVKGAKVLEGTSDAALGGLFKEASVWGKESALWNARYAEKMAEGASTGFLGTFKNNIVGFGKYMGEALPGSLRALRNLPQALRGTGAGLKALNSRQLIKSATGITGGTSGFLYSMLHYMSVVSLLHHSDIYLEPMDMAEPIPEDQKPSFLETAVHLAIIMAGARGMGNGDFFLRRVLEKHHDAEVAKVVGEIRTGLENIHQIGVRQGDKVGGLRQSWNDDAQRNGGHYRPLERLVQLLDVVRDVSQLKAAELRLLDHKVGYEETGVDRQTEAIQETKTAIAGRLLFECLTSIAARGDVARDGTIAISRDQLQTIRREGEIFNRLFGSRVRFEQVGSPRGGKTYYRFTSIKDGKSAGTFLSDSVFTPYPGQSRSNVDMDNLRKVRPGVYTPKTEGPKGDRPTTPGGFLTTNLL